VLVRDARALESMEKIDTLVVDKTGTLTLGKPEVTQIKLYGSFSEQEVLQAAASVESHSEHPLAGAVIRAAQLRMLPLLPVTDFEARPGSGVAATVAGPRGPMRVLVGKSEMIREAGADWKVSIGGASVLTMSSALELPSSVFYVGIDGKLAAMIAVADPLRDSTRDALKGLRAQGIDVIMATGDHRSVAIAIGQRLGIEHVEAEVLPHRKAELVRELQSQGKRVAMAGDGVNDAPALAQADVGIAMGTGTDVALESGDIALLKGDLRGIVRARRLSKAVMRNIRQNLFFAFVYNAAGIPLAAGALYPLFHMTLNPIFAAAAMSLSSVSVITNSLRLRRVAL
jgi:Cu+-exporting ATPase